jgi:hypothetical protein
LDCLFIICIFFGNGKESDTLPTCQVADSTRIEFWNKVWLGRRLFVTVSKLAMRSYSITLCKEQPWL